MYLTLSQGQRTSFVQTFQTTLLSFILILLLNSGSMLLKAQSAPTLSLSKNGGTADIQLDLPQNAALNEAILISFEIDINSSEGPLDSLVFVKDNAILGNRSSQVSIGGTGTANQFVFTWSSTSQPVSGSGHLLTLRITDSLVVDDIDSSSITLNSWLTEENIQDEPVSLDESLIQRPKVYPNPARENLKLDFAQSAARVFSLTALAGSLKRSWSSPDKSQQIRVDDLPAGYYLLTISTKEGNRYAQKVCITH